MTKKSEPVRLGLRLAIGGAAESWHNVNESNGDAVPGKYHPVFATPADEAGLEYDEAVRLGNECDALELVEMSQAVHDLAIVAYRDALGLSKDGTRTLKGGPRATDPAVLERIEDETETIDKGEVKT